MLMDMKTLERDIIMRVYEAGEYGISYDRIVDKYPKSMRLNVMKMITRLTDMGALLWRDNTLSHPDHPPVYTGITEPKDTSSYVYFVGSYHMTTNELEAIKIGKANEPEKRLLSIQSSTPHRLVLLKTIKCKDSDHAYETESVYHKKYQSLKIKGEWYSVSDELQSEINGI